MVQIGKKSKINILIVLALTFSGTFSLGNFVSLRCGHFLHEVGLRPVFAVDSDGDQIEITANTPTSNDGSLLPGESRSETIAISLLVFMILMVFLIAFLSSSSRWSLMAILEHVFHGPRAMNLFLGVKFKILVQNQADQVSINNESIPSSSDTIDQELGYLRYLDMKSAMCVTSKKLTKGTKIRLFLDTLPRFPEVAKVVDCEAASSKSIGGEPENYLVNLKFVELGEYTRKNLLEYLEFLTQKQRGNLSKVHSFF